VTNSYKKNETMTTTLTTIVIIILIDLTSVFPCSHGLDASPHPSFTTKGLRRNGSFFAFAP